MDSKVTCLFCGWTGMLDVDIFVCPDCKSEGNLVACGGGDDVDK